MRNVPSQAGFLLLPVAFMLAVIALAAFWLNQQGAFSVDTLAGETEIAAAEFAAEAGLNHAIWQANQASCENYQNVPSTAFGYERYQADLTPASGSPITIAATGTSARGAVRTLTRTPVPIYEPSTNVLALKPDATDGKDTVLSAAAAAKNYGVFQTLTAHLGAQHSLLEFPVASIPSNALIRGAQMRLWATGMNIAGEIGAYGVTKSWNEGTGNGDPCDNGATWWYTDCWDNWSALGGDADAEPSAKQSVTSPGTWVEFDLTDLAQAWVSGERPNYGVLLKPTGSADVNFRSSDAAAPDEYPELIVTYACECGESPTVTATRQPGPTDGKDAWISGAQTSRNYGAHEDLYVEESVPHRAVIEFDVASLPTSAMVQSARLELYANNLHSSGSGNVYVHAITDSWVEGTCQGSGCTADGVTWDTRDGVAPWSSPGVDYDSTPVATTFVDTADAWHSWDVTSAVIEWLASGENNGLLIKGDAGFANVVFDSSDTADSSLRPKLIIDYLCPCGDCDAGAPPSCSADYVPTTEAASWPYGDGSNYADMHGVTWVPEGFVLDGVTAPVRGAFVAVDWNEDFFTMYDVEGTVLSQTLGTPASSMDGVTLVEGGLHAGKLAVVQDMASDNVLHFVDPTGAVSTVSIDIGAISGDPSGITYIGESDSGTYDEHLAIVDGNNGEINIVDQTGTLVHIVDVSALVGDMQGIVHLRGTDKFLTVDQADDLGRIIQMDAQITDSYGLNPFTLVRPRAAAINWDNCDHVVGNNRGASGSDEDEVVYLNAGSGGGQTVLLVSGNAGAPSAKDLGIEGLMTGWGFSVDWIDDGDTQDNFNTKMDAADAVYISSTVGGGTLADKATNTTTGVVNEFAGKLDNFGFSSGTSSTASSDRFTKTDGLHYITESFGGNFVTVFTATASMPVPGGTLAPDLQNVGEVSGAPALVTLDAGATGWDGNPVPARRAHLPYTNVSASGLTTDGELIMYRTILWVAGEGGGSGGGGGPTTLTLTPVQDTALRTATPSVYGTDPDMRLNNGASFDYRPLLQFDVSSIAPGTTITSATMRLYTYSVIQTGAFTASAYKITEEWAESWQGNGGAAWYERLKVGGGPSGTLDWTTSGGTYDTGWQSDTTFNPVVGEWVEWDLTPLVQEWVDGVSANHGVIILPVTEGPYVNFLSKDWTTDPTQHPQLVIEYTAP